MLDSAFGAVPAADVRFVVRVSDLVSSPTFTDDAPTFRIAPDHPCLAGHFPGRPLVPAVLILDEVAAALHRHHGRRVVRIVEARFSAPLAPDQVAHIHVEPVAAGGVWRFEVRRGSALLARGRLETTA